MFEDEKSCFTKSPDQFYEHLINSV